MRRSGRAIFGGLLASLLAATAASAFAPTGFGGARLPAASAVTLAGHGFHGLGGGFGGGPRFAGHIGGVPHFSGHIGGIHSFHSYGGPHLYHRGFAYSGNWNHWHGHHRWYRHGYPIYFYGGGYYPYYDDYYSDDYSYPYYGCYYSPRYHARICPDY